MSTATRRHLTTLTSLATVALATAGTLTPTAAHAAARDGRCDDGEFCYYFNSGQQGAVSDFTQSVKDYGTTQPDCYEFRGSDKGAGYCIKNEAASVWNRSDKTVRIYHNSGYEGAVQVVPPNTKAQLRKTTPTDSLYNENASHEFVGDATPSPTGCKTDGSDTKLPSTILVYRVSAGRIDRVAFKEYVKNVLPNEWIPGWHTQSLRAGAMAAKTYAWEKALHSTRKTANGACFDVADSTSDQVYRPGSAESSTSSAVDATWTTRMSRGGKIFSSHYCSTTTACGAWVSGDWMSQHGSQDMATKGSSFQSILKHYYTGIAFDTVR